MNARGDGATTALPSLETIMDGNDPSDTSEYIAGCMTLATGELLRIAEPRSLLVYVAQGEVWITEEGATDDVILGVGSRFRLTRPGAAIVEALAPAVLLLTSPEEVPAQDISSIERPVPPARAEPAAHLPSGTRVPSRASVGGQGLALPTAATR
jgi:hypothetical protein